MRENNANIIKVRAEGKIARDCVAADSFSGFKLLKKVF
jgi:hypothetical protein